MGRTNSQLTKYHSFHHRFIYNIPKAHYFSKLIYLWILYPRTNMWMFESLQPTVLSLGTPYRTIIFQAVVLDFSWTIFCLLGLQPLHENIFSKLTLFPLQGSGTLMTMLYKEKTKMFDACNWLLTFLNLQVCVGYAFQLCFGHIGMESVPDLLSYWITLQKHIYRYGHILHLMTPNVTAWVHLLDALRR